MKMKKSEKDRKHIVDGVIISLILVFEVINSKLLIIFIPILLLRILMYSKHFNNKLTVNSNTIWLILIFCLTTINGIRLYDNAQQFSIIYNSITFLNIILVQVLLSNDKRNIKKTLRVVVVISTFILGFAIILLEYKMILFRWSDFLNGNSGYRLGISSGINPNAITWTFGFLALLTAYFILFQKKYRFLPIYLIQIIIILFTGSKNGFILSFLPLLVYGIKSIKKINVFYLVLFITFFVIFWISIHKYPIMYTLIGKRIDSMLYTLGLFHVKGNIDVGSTEKRLNMISYAIKMFWQKPFIGWGIGAFAILSGYGYYCHNNFMEILVSGGLFLFIIYYGFLFVKFINFILKNKDKDVLSLILFLSLILLDFSTVNFYSNIVFFLRTSIMLELINLRGNEVIKSEKITN